MWRHVANVRTSISEECIASIIMVTRISELETALATNHYSSRSQSVTTCLIPDYVLRCIMAANDGVSSASMLMSWLGGASLITNSWPSNHSLTGLSSHPRYVLVT
jgi:hypothetical protein